MITQDTYPLKAVIDLVGDYFDCSISYMIGLAILRGRDFRLLGVDLWDEYQFERPNVEYLIGFARGRGLRVETAEGSALFGRKTDREVFKTPVVYPVRYGYL